MFLRLFDFAWFQKCNTSMGLINHQLLLICTRWISKHWRRGASDVPWCPYTESSVTSARWCTPCVPNEPSEAVLPDPERKLRVELPFGSRLWRLDKTWPQRPAGTWTSWNKQIAANFDSGSVTFCQSFWYCSREGQIMRVHFSTFVTVHRLYQYLWIFMMLCIQRYPESILPSHIKM